MWLDTFNEMRKKSAMSLDEISAKSGVPKGTLAKITSGITKAPPLETMRKLVYSMGYTLDDLDKGLEVSNNFSKEERDHIKKYRRLDQIGKEAVDGVLNTEYKRYEETEAQKQAETPPEPVPEPAKVIPLFTSAAAAGIASPLLGEDYDDYTLKKGDPQNAMFAVRVQGDSMEPHFPDGSIVFCDKTPMRIGDIGVFILDGGSLLKQWCVDNYGNAYLFSLNRKRADADVTVRHSSGQTLTCMGRVITKKRFPLPIP